MTHCLKVTILGSGCSTGVPRVDGLLGRLRSGKSEKPAFALLGLVRTL